MNDFEIYCPQCAWRPRTEDRWVCTPDCGAVWNTFWTRGMCPGCAHQWHLTQCLACHRHSPHRDWYHQPQREQRARTRALENVI